MVFLYGEAGKFTQSGAKVKFKINPPQEDTTDDVVRALHSGSLQFFQSAIAWVDVLKKHLAAAADATDPAANC